VYRQRPLGACAETKTVESHGDWPSTMGVHIESGIRSCR
jgi:hypothetical protein